MRSIPQSVAEHAVTKRRLWTSDELSLLRALYPTDILVSEIAERIGRTKRAVWSKARSNGLCRPNPSRNRKRATSDLFTATQSQIVVERVPDEPPPPKVFEKTKLGGRLIRWFDEPIRRLERMWLANVDHVAIATVLGEGFTPKSVLAKARRMGLPARYGFTLIDDVETARRIDAAGAPTPTVLMQGGKKLQRRLCSLTGTPFWSRDNRLSRQAKETLYWQRQAGTEFSVAY